MQRIRVASLRHVPPGEMIEAMVAGVPYAVCNVDGELHAIEGVCPHQGGPLAQGALHGRMVVCPWHAWEFDCTTGLDANVVVEGDDVILEVPDAGTSRS